MKIETIQAKATYLKDSLEADDYRYLPSSVSKGTVKLAHCHELIAAGLGFKSKKSMLSYCNDPRNWDDSEVYIERYYSHSAGHKLNTQLVMDRVSNLKDTPLHKSKEEFVIHSVAEAIAPPCHDCNEKDANGRFIHDGDGSDPQIYVCRACSEEDKYDTCVYCGSGTLYKASDINRAGECPEHAGESYMDEEERDDWDSFIEYCNK